MQAPQDKTPGPNWKPERPNSAYAMQSYLRGRNQVNRKRGYPREELPEGFDLL